MNLAQLNESAQLLPWHTTPWQKLTGRFPDIGHGLLLYGKAGCGKQAFASHFVKWVLCSNKQALEACGVCRSCIWIASGTHPQLKLISPDFDEKKQSYTAIKIDQIREISDFVQQTVEGWRIVMIYPAEQLNIASANALLKMLEEPGERVLFILISHAMLTLPATIRSRVQHIALDRILPEQAQQYLIERAQAEENQQKIALALAMDMPLKAEQILDSEWFKQRHTLVTDWLDLVRYKSYPIQFSSRWFKILDFKDILVIFGYTLQDCIAYKLQQPIKQTDIAVGELEKFYSLAQLFAIYEKMTQISRLSAQNVQTQLILDDLAICLMNIESVESNEGDKLHDANQ